MIRLKLMAGLATLVAQRRLSRSTVCLLPTTLDVKYLFAQSIAAKLMARPVASQDRYAVLVIVALALVR